MVRSGTYMNLLEQSKFWINSFQLIQVRISPEYLQKIVSNKTNWKQQIVENMDNCGLKLFLFD